MPFRLGLFGSDATASTFISLLPIGSFTVLPINRSLVCLGPRLERKPVRRILGLTTSLEVVLWSLATRLRCLRFTVGFVVVRFGVTARMCFS